MRSWVVGVGVAAIVTALGAVTGAGMAGSDARKGGTFRITYAIGSGIDYVDPALAYTAPAWALGDTTCARLMSYPDKPPPAAFRLTPEVATGPPKVARDLKTYTFTLRSGFRFSDGKPVRASAFARAINRALAPQMSSPWAGQLLDIVGADDVRARRTEAARGVVARGNVLTVSFVRPVTDFATRTAMPYMCAVPPTLPADPEGMGVFPAAGPYSITEYRPGERVVIRRNRFYGGSRPHHVDGFDVDLLAASPRDMIERVKRGDADWGHQVAGPFFDPSINPPLYGTFGFNKDRFFVKRGLTVRLLAFNSSRPLFRDNPELRKAVNLALDRFQLGGGATSERTDQYLPHSMPGFRDADIYSLAGRDLARAKDLARGNLRTAKAVMYTTNFGPPLATAQVVRQHLAEIGLEVTIQPIPVHIASAAYVGKLAAPGEAWDIALVLWAPPIPDPFAYLNALLDTDFIGSTNMSGFSSTAVDADVRQSARLTQAAARARSYGELDVRLARDAAPLAALDVLNEVTLVSARVGCIVLRPALDLTAACLK